MKEWDLGKIAGQVVGGIWSSVRDWDYFTRDSLGQQVRASADSLWNIHPAEDGGKPPESELTEITIEAVTEDETGDFSPAVPSPQATPEKIQPNLNSPDLNSPLSSPPSSPPPSRNQSPVLRNPESYQYFITEAQDLLVEIEGQLFNLNPEKDTAQIYSLMRATHTLKGASANVGQDTIKTIAHNLEDVFRAMLSPEAVIDPELESMLFEGYECLRLALSAELAHEYGQTDDLLNRAADLFARFQEKLGDCFENPAPLPSSSEMGFDLTRSIFEMGVEQRLSELKEMLENPESSEHLLVFLEESAEVFLGLGESLGLSGFCAIAQSTLNALSYHPDAVLDIAPIVYQDFYQAQQAVFAGDRTHGGTPSPQLLQWAGESPSDPAPLPEDFGELEYLEDSQDFAPSDAILLDTAPPTEPPESPPAAPPPPPSC
ncbi:Hpt domain-containing protein, partial [Spirulina subsalsa FACHB-351]